MYQNNHQIHPHFNCKIPLKFLFYFLFYRIANKTLLDQISALIDEMKSNNAKNSSRNLSLVEFLQLGQMMTSYIF